jgi:hypothetical protein
MRHAEPPPGVDNTGLELTATFVRERKGVDVRGVGFPAVRSLADSISVDDGAPNNPHTRFRFYRQLDCRIAEGDRFWSIPRGASPALPAEPVGFPPPASLRSSMFEAGPARYARWMRYKVPQRDPLGRLDRLALPPLIDTMPTALHRAIGPGDYRFYAPSLDLTTYVVDDTEREWLLVAAVVRRARAGWAIADVEVWDDEGRFIAYGAQAMFIHNLSGEPPIVDASARSSRRT